jgi:hypothetical protein
MAEKCNSMRIVPPTRKLALCLLALVAVAGCRRQPPPAVAPAAFVLDDAMEHWYGRYDVSTKMARANLPEHTALDLGGTDFAPGDPVDITAIFDTAYLQGGHSRHLIVTAAVPHRSDKPGRPGDDQFNCLACRPVIGMAVFTLRNNTWLLESENAAAELAGSHGNAPQVQLVTLGADVHGARLESDFEAADESSRSLSLLVPWQETVERAFATETAHSNRGACGAESPMREPCYSWQRAVAFVAVPGQQYDDLTVTTIGTQPPPASAAAGSAVPVASASARRRGRSQRSPAPQAVPFTGTERYRFRDGHYLRLTAEEGDAR